MAEKQKQKPASEPFKVPAPKQAAPSNKIKVCPDCGDRNLEMTVVDAAKPGTSARPAVKCLKCGRNHFDKVFDA